MEYKVDVNKFMVGQPQSMFEAIKKVGELSIDLLEAYQIIQSVVMFPEDQHHEWNFNRMKKFLEKYSIETPKETT